MRDTSPPEKGSRPEREGSGPVFWRELYGFVAITLAGICLALLVVPPKARRYWSLLQHEADLAARNARIRRHTRQIEQAARDFRTDPQYRESVLRTRLDVRKKDEVFLKPEAPDGR